MTLMRAALPTKTLVPKIYAWSNAIAESPGWTIEEYKVGISLDVAFAQFTQTQKEKVLDQIAGVIAAVQAYSLPDTVTGYGGLSFNEDGEVVTGPMSTHDGAFGRTYEELFPVLIKKEMQWASCLVADE